MPLLWGLGFYGCPRPAGAGRARRLLLPGTPGKPVDFPLPGHAGSRPGMRESRRGSPAACKGQSFSNQRDSPLRFPRRRSHRTAEPKTLEPLRAAACAGTAQAAAPCIGGQSKSIRTKTVRMLSCFTDTALSCASPIGMLVFAFAGLILVLDKKLSKLLIAPQARQELMRRLLRQTAAKGRR